MSSPKKRQALRKFSRDRRTKRRRPTIRRPLETLAVEALERRLLLTTVTGVDPAAESFNASPSTDVSATFDQNVAAATDQTFTVHSLQSGQFVGGKTTVTTSGNVATHNPTTDFFAGEQIQATVTSDLATAGGSQVWQFRTAATAGSGLFNDTGQRLGTAANNTNSFAVALGDVDGDGDLDMFVANDGQGSRVYLNDGAAVFSDSGQSLGATAGRDVALGDLDGDGDLDAVVANTSGQGNRVWQNNGSGIFTEVQSLGTGNSLDVRLADLDGDGDLDAFFANNGGNRVWLNNGGVLTDSNQSLGDHDSRGVGLGDVDGDGDLDAFVGNFLGAADRIWLNNGSGTFSDSGQTLGNPVLKSSRDVVMGDVDGDGDVDAFVVGRGYNNRLFLNDGTGIFTDSGQVVDAPVNPFFEYGATMGDVDADGDLDIVTAGESIAQWNRLFVNDGEGNFTESGQVIGGQTYGVDTMGTFGIELGDLDGDGDLDIAFANGNTFPNINSTSRVWLNQNLTPSVRLGVDSPSIAEAAAVSTVTATLSGPHTAPVTIDLGLSGTATESDDYIVSATQIVIAPGATTGSIAITAVQDAVDEPDETIVVDIVSATNGQEAGTQQVTVTILDDDEPIPVPEVTLAVDNAAIPEDSGVATFTADLSLATTVPVTIDFALSGTADASDYTASATQLVIAPGATSGSITITAVQDDADEPDETVVVDISNVVGGTEAGTQQQVTTITDDDEPVVPDVTLTVDPAAIAEAAGVATFAIALSQPTTAAVTVDLSLSGTASAGDYTISATQVVIAPGASSGTVVVTAVQDEVDEPDETVIVDISNVAGGTEVGDQQQTATILDDDIPPSFAVTSFSATDSGFSIQFTNPLDGNDLNLYDTQNAGLGASDVVVSGSSSGNVVGSLIVGDTWVEFVKSGGPVLADTYTVTLRSATDGFEDSGGMLLDGNGDGTGGDDYVNTWTVAAAPEGARTVSVPDFVRGPGQDVNLPADGTTGIPISISDGANVRAADIRISYDPALLSITGATAPAGGTVVVNTNTPGLAILVYFSTTALPAGPSDFIQLQATVPTENASANYGRQQLLDVHDVVIGDGNDNEFPVVVDDAFHFATYFADVSGNGRINASDAAQVARYAALIDSGFAASLTTDPILVGDISGNGRINAADASRVAQFAALIPVPEIPPVPGGVLIAGVVVPQTEVESKPSATETEDTLVAALDQGFPGVDRFVSRDADRVDTADVDAALDELEPLLGDELTSDLSDAIDEWFADA